LGNRVPQPDEHLGNVGVGLRVGNEPSGHIDSLPDVVLAVRERQVVDAAAALRLRGQMRDRPQPGHRPPFHPSSAGIDQQVGYRAGSHRGVSVRHMLPSMHGRSA
jgi:hypothetical protein